MKQAIVWYTAIFILFCGITISFGQTAREKARRHFDRGMAAVEMAKSPEDYAAAIEEFEQAARLAPNWPDIYYNLGLVQEKAGNYGDAAISFMLYLQRAPNASDADATKSLINKLEYRFEQSSTGKTLLHEAAIRGRKEAVELLIAKGADTNAKDNDGYTPLGRAVETEHKEVVELLIAKGADINAKDNGGYTLLHKAIITRAQKEMVEMLIAKGADINTKSEYGSPLHYAIRGNQKEVAELLIAKGADVNVRDENQVTPLHEAAIGGHKGVAELLIAKGADINAKDKFGKTPLHETIIQCQKEVAELLIVKSADINVKDNYGNTPLNEAKHSYKLGKGVTQKEMIDLLKKQGAK